MPRKSIIGIFAGLLLLASAPTAFAHAILVRSTPADHAVIHSGDVHLTLDYNSRIDAARSVLSLTDANGESTPVRRLPSAKPSELQADAGRLSPGSYSIHWQVLASDGHITRGDVTFTVAQ